MKVYQGSSEFVRLNQSAQAQVVLTIGNFDGLHIGHQQLISILKQKGLLFGGLRSLLYTFDPHPSVVIGGGGQHVRLFDLKDQEYQADCMGIEHLIWEPFNRSFSELSPEQFLEDFIKPLRSRAIVVGFDFAFGKSRAGSLQVLKEFCENNKIDFTIVPAVQIDGEKVSTSRIKKVLQQGQVELARKLLGRAFYFQGIVKKGFQRGRTIGVPTANLEPETEFIPKTGVYVSRIKLSHEVYWGVTNVGFNPTFQNDKNSNPIKVETHIFNFDKEIYGHVLFVELLSYLRSEVKFSSIEELKKQLFLDIQNSKTWVNEGKNEY